MNTSSDTTATRETRGFQTEVKQLLHLMIHSLYSNKEIFLRELVSNASDASDKLRFEAIANPSLMEGETELWIRIEFDAKARTISITDNGIGMSRDEVISNIGTIAKSGTREFFKSLTGDQAKDSHLIGQFGVGFYSAFIVADKVTLRTRRAGMPTDEGTLWESDGQGDYAIEAIDRPARGTQVTLHLREGEDELLSDLRLRGIVRKYSDHIAIPIRMEKYEWNAEKKGSIPSGKDETVNQASALWARSKSEITDEQYQEFYKHVAHDFEPPLAWAHARVEGRQEYTQLLYVPARAPFDLWDRQHPRGLKLYVRRVFIMDDAEHLLPAYLRFVRGVVDSNDLPLNVSREILQSSKDVDSIRSGCAKRVLGMLEDMAENQKDNYVKFWREFGRVMKEGLGEDLPNKEKLGALMRFSSTHLDAEDQSVSLKDYVSRMKTGQDRIYYVTAETFLAAKNSPHLEVFRKRGIEVLLLSDRVDEWVVAHLTEFEGKKLTSVARGDTGLEKIGSQEERNAEDTLRKELEGQSAGLIEKLKKALSEKAKDVRISSRLTESPSCLIADETDMGGNLARILKAAGQKVPEARPVLEINPGHELVKRLVEQGSNAGLRFDEWAHLLFDQALLAEGGTLEDPARFVRRVNELMLEVAGAKSRIWTPGG